MNIKIEHIGLWVDNLELMRTFYCTYFGLDSSDLYLNPTTTFSSYFLTFGLGNTRLELMHRPDILEEPDKRGFSKGIAHFALTVGDKDAVHLLTERLRTDGYTIASEPRTTGDGYYESVVLDPEGNYVELAAAHLIAYA
ncbi:VOC family protein [Sphingobacterium sp. Mn56C]|uniref:VOC family protein n=1 Tax=Sphingobacterium sp. Mn56C TaxID=3395261 RepID=UPI003BD99CA6